MEKYSINTDQQQLMTYFRQGITSQTQVLANMATVPNANELTLQDRRHDILHFISRPIDVYKGSWNTSQLQNEEIIPTGLLFPDLLYQNPQYQEKMRGFVGLRGKLRVRILFNPQKFQQGELMIYWIPNYTNLTSKAAMIRKSLAGKSGCAHIFLKCEGGTEQSIEIPYVNQHTFYNSVTNQGNFGALFITVLLPLKSKISGDSIGLRIQAWLEDPELEYPTAVLPVITQGMEEEQIHSETADAPKGFSNITINDVVDNLKDFQFKPSYLTKTATNLLQLAGYQKPTNVTAIQRNSLRTASYMANAGGEYMGHKMALAHNNELPDFPEAGGSTMNEMNIINVCKAPTYYKTFQIQKVNPENFVGFSDDVHPAKFTQANTDGVMDSSFVGYVSSCFSQWRGSMKYTFHVAKTGFHSCTLRLTWVPGLYTPFANPTEVPQGINLDRAYQQTYDLKDLNEFDFVVPYTSTREFLNVINPFSVGQQSVAKRNYTSGCIIVDVFVPLRNPETVVDEIDIAVFVAGGDDICFANPTAPIIFPYYNPISTVEVQGFGFDEQHDRVEAIQNTSELVGAAKPKYQLDASAYCTGEIITDIKQLLSRFGSYGVSSPLTNDTYLHIAPFDFQQPLTPSQVQNRQTKGFDFLDFFSFIYGFYRGGVRLVVDPGLDGYSNNTTFHAKLRTSLNNYYPTGPIPRISITSATRTKDQFLYSPFATQIMKPSLEGVMELEIPYYSLAHITPVLVADQTQDQVEESNYPFPIVTLFNYAVPNPNGSWSPLILRACSDDFRFQYLLGPPQVHFLNYEFNAANEPIQYGDVLYSNSEVTRVGNTLRGFFGSNYTFNSSPATSDFSAPNQFLAINGNTIYFLPEDEYRVSFANQYLRISNSAFNLPAVLNFFSNPVAVTGNLTTALTDFQIIAPTPTNLPQASPFPCSSITLAAISYNSSNQTLIVSSWSSTPIDVSSTSSYFNLPSALLIAVNNVSTDRPLILLSQGESIRLEINPASNGIRVYRNFTQIGNLIQTISSNPGFQLNTPTYSPTIVTAL